MVSRLQSKLSTLLVNLFFFFIIVYHHKANSSIDRTVSAVVVHRVRDGGGMEGSLYPYFSRCLFNVSFLLLSTYSLPFLFILHLLF